MHAQETNVRFVPPVASRRRRCRQSGVSRPIPLLRNAIEPEFSRSAVRDSHSGNLAKRPLFHILLPDGCSVRWLFRSAVR